MTHGRAGGHTARWRGQKKKRGRGPVYLDGGGLAKAGPPGRAAHLAIGTCGGEMCEGMRVKWGGGRMLGCCPRRLSRSSPDTTARRGADRTRSSAARGGHQFLVKRSPGSRRWEGARRSSIASVFDHPSAEERGEESRSDIDLGGGGGGYIAARGKSVVN